MEQRIFPQAADLIVTRDCNLCCPVCWGYEMPKFVQLPLEKRLEMIDILSSQGVDTMSFTGGEPLLENSLPNLIYRASMRGVRTVLFTNSLLLPELKDAVLSATDKISFSLDGHNEETNAIARGSGHFKSVCEAIDIIKNEYPIQTQVITVVTKKNKKFLGEIGSLLEKMTEGLDFAWKLNYYFLIGKKKPGFQLPYEKFGELAEQTKQEFSGRLKVRYSLPNHDNSYLLAFPDGNLYTTQGREYILLGNIFKPEACNRELLKEIEINSSRRRGKPPKIE